MLFHSPREDRERTIQALAQEYPKTFFTVGERRKPLKHDIEKDIEAELAKDNDHPLLDFDITDALAWYRSHIGYQKSCSVAGVNRLDLQGRPASKVTASEAREADAEAADGIARMRDRQRRINGLPAQLVAAPQPVAKSAAIAVNTKLDNAELITELEKQLALVQSVLGTDADDLLRQQLARSALKLMADEISTIIARLDDAH
jgi:sRNA-binding protein